MQPIGKLTLHTNANDEGRIGPNKRNPNLMTTQNIEGMLEALSPLAITCDVRHVHPPFFTEFCYHDSMNGINLTTLSAEVTARLAEKASKLSPISPFPMGELMDKYELKEYTKKHRKVIFIAGSNSTNLIDQSKVQQLMHEDDEWVIKLHPVTTDQTIRELGTVFGYHRLIDPKVSGMSVLNNAEEVATMSSSEFYMIARLLGKPVIDVGRFDRGWLCCYFHITRLLKNDSSDYKIIESCLMSELSGHLRHNYGQERCKALAERYFKEAMEMRETFRMLTNQRLTVSDKTFVEWK